jgi:hypothetical protein
MIGWASAKCQSVCPQNTPAWQIRAVDGGRRCVGVDPEGIELPDGRTALRLTFPQRVTGPGPLRAALKVLADEARGI